MRPPRHAFSAAALAAGAAVLGGVVAFVLGALPRASGAQAVFATALLCLVAAAALGPFLFTATEGAPRWRPAVHGALRAAAFGAGAAAACALVALARDAAVAAALAAGSLAGLCGFAAVLGGVVAFVLGALPRASGAQAVFATALLCLVAAAALGPFLFTATEGAPRWRPAVHGALRAAAFGAGAAAACALVALARDGAVAAALAAGSLAGLCGFAAGAAAWALGGGPARIAVAAAALLCLATPFYWDDAFLLRAGDRKASAARAYRINPAAAAGTTLGYSWFLAPEVYRNNQTAESLGVGVRLGGAGDFALRLAPLAAVAAAAGLWRRP